MLYYLHLLLVSLHLGALERQPLWPSIDKMPDFQPHQIAEMTNVSKAPGFNPDEFCMPYRMG